jgi:hypothetical protein
MHGFSARWWVAGGWALDLFVGSLREHDDVDLLVLRSDQHLIRRQFPSWDIQVAHSGRLEPWPPGDHVELPRSGFWARSDPNGPWELQFLLAECDDEEWWFRRDPSIRLAVDRIGLVSSDGYPYLRPELVLLYKSRLARDVDAADFERTLPKLGDSTRRRLASWLPPEHPWQPELGG